MKKTNVYLMEILLLIYIIMFMTVITKYCLAYVDVINIIFFAGMSLCCYFLFGFQKRDNLKDYSAIQTTIICYIIYYIFIYILGLFFGFVSNYYSLKIINIIKNIFITVCFYVFRELFRYMIIRTKKRENKLSFALVTVLLTILDIIMEINISDFSNVSSIFQFVEVSVIPNIAINLILSYLAYNFSYKTLLLFILFYRLPNYFMPIFPNLGDYFGNVLKIIFFFYCYYQFSYILEKWEQKEKYNKRFGKKTSLGLIVVPILLFVGVVSGLFKYHLFAIGSNSMVPSFSRGDTVLIEKLSKDELDSLQIGDVLAFHYNNVIIVHRIVEIDKSDNGYIFKTKGDNNTSVDSWNVDSNMVYGKVKFVIKYIGIPSVEIGELINK